jgi:hypothetical protein
MWQTRFCGERKNYNGYWANKYMKSFKGKKEEWRMKKRKRRKIFGYHLTSYR